VAKLARLIGTPMMQIIEMNKSSALIVAAGLSTRMGQEKFALEFRDGETFLEHIAGQYHRFGCRKIIAVLNPKGQLLMNELSLKLPGQLQVAVNEQPERGRFSSIKAGLKLLSDEDCVFVQNVDNPHINEKLLLALTSNLKNADYIYPVFQNKGGHPVLIRNQIVKTIVNQEDDDLILKDFFKRFKKSQVDVLDEGILKNINTREEYESWKTTAQSRSAPD
jgi:molybdenum cofactor cytidylyltransferase